MRILFLGQSLDCHTGWGRYAWEIVKRIKTRHHLTVLVEEGSKKPIEVVGLKKLASWKDLLSNIQVVKHYASDFEIIHALDGWPYGFLACYAGKKQPFFINGIGTYAVVPLYSRLKSHFLKKAYRQAKAIFCISNYTKQEILKKVSLKNLEVVHLGVDHEKFCLLNTSRLPYQIVGVGALKFRKGYHIALEAIREVVQKFPEVNYKIVGREDDSRYTNSLRLFVSQNHLEQNVEFLGELTDEELVRLYNESSLFLLLPQNYKKSFEGFGLVFLEAAACGLPVIGTYENGCEDAILSGQNGFLVPQNDPLAAASAIQRILGGLGLQENFRRRGLEFARQFTWEKTVQTYFQAYEHARNG